MTKTVGVGAALVSAVSFVVGALALYWRS